VDTAFAPGHLMAVLLELCEDQIKRSSGDIKPDTRVVFMAQERAPENATELSEMYAKGENFFE
jgi:hypothetical protein